MSSMYDHGLGRRDANYEALTPVDFIARAAEVYGDRLAVVHGKVRRNWRQTYERAQRLAGALAQAGIKRGDTVAVMLPNIPAMVEAHFGVPMLGAVLNTLNTRLDTPSVLFMLGHGEARALIIDTEYAELAQRARAEFPHLAVISVHDLDGAPAALPGATDYEAFLAAAPATFDWQPPADEWDAIALNYTSGTTGDPKGVVYHYRGAYLNAVSNILEWDMPKHPVYLWTLPLFHCNGWCFAWTVAARRRQRLPAQVRSQDRVRPDDRRAAERVRTWSPAPRPPPSVIAKMKEIGFELTHVYGLTEVYGPPPSAPARHPGTRWKTKSAPCSTRARACAITCRPACRYAIPKPCSKSRPTSRPCEIMFRGNICMKGYLKNERATEDAFAGGWFHTGTWA